MTPDVSVIVPVYKVEKYLERALRSLEEQTLKNIEFILVDDGSPDNCAEICDIYAQKDHRFKVIHKHNEGLGIARNTGIEIATGKYIGFMDSDDAIDPNMYNSLYKSAQSANADCALCGMRKELSNKKFITLLDFNNEHIFEKKEITNLMLDIISSPPKSKKERNIQISVCRGIYKKDIIIKNNLNFYSERIYPSEDLIFQLNFFNLSSKIIFIPYIFYTYYFNQSSLSKTFNPEKIIRMENMYKHIKILTQKIDPKSLRINKLFIGFCRNQIKQINNLPLSRKERNKLMSQICTNSTLNKVSLEYPTKYFSVPNRIFYLLMIKKQYKLLAIYSQLHTFFKHVLS